MPPPGPIHMHPPPVPMPPPSESTGDVERTMKGLVRLWPIVGPIVLALIGIGFATRSHGEAIARLEGALTAKASTSDLGHAVEELRDIASRVQREADKREQHERELATTLNEIRRDLERVCARVQCGR